MKNIMYKKHTDILEASEETIDVNLDELIDKDPELQKDNKLVKAAKAIWNTLKKPLKSFAANKAGDLIDEVLLGQFKDSMMDIYKKEKLDGLDEDGLKTEFEELSKDSSFKQGTEKSKLDSRKDDNTSTDIDDKSLKYEAIWFSKEKDTNIAKILSELVADIQNQAKQIEEQQKELEEKLKKMKIAGLTDEDMKTYGPALKQLVDQNKSAKDIAKALEKMKKEVKESYDASIRGLMMRSKMLNESFVLTEDMKNVAMTNALLESQQFQKLIYEKMLNEGILSSLGSLAKKAGSAVKDFGAKAIKAVTNKSLQGILSLGGIATGILTGGLAAELVIRAMYAVERHGKVLKNAFERQYKRFANSKGVFAQMDFKIVGQEDSGYSMRFYSKDMTWRVLNTKDQLKQPSLKYSKEIVDGEIGKKFRDQLKKVWDPLFSEAKGGKIDFEALFKQAKGLDIPEKPLKLYKDFADNYDTIVANCCTSPKIDTRAQSLKKDEK